MRATGMPAWMAAIAVSQQPRTTGKRQTPAATASGNAVQPQGHLGDDAERAFGADEQPREIIAGRGFARAPRCGISSPFGSTTFSASTLSFMVP